MRILTTNFSKLPGDLVRALQFERLIGVVHLLGCFLDHHQRILDLALLVPQLLEQADEVYALCVQLPLQPLADDGGDETQQQVPPERILTMYPQRKDVGIILGDVEHLLDLLTRIVEWKHLHGVDLRERYPDEQSERGEVAVDYEEENTVDSLDVDRLLVGADQIAPVL